MEKADEVRDKEELSPEDQEKLLAEEKEQEEAERLEAEEAERLKLEKEEKKEYTQEELDAMINEEEAEQLAEWGLPQFKSFEEMAKGVRKFFDEDKTVYPIVKKLAAKLNMTPHQFIQAVEEKVGGEKPAKPKGKEDEPDRHEDRFKALESDRGMIRLDLAWDRFQRLMEKKEIDVPDDLKSTVIDHLPRVLPKKYDPEKINWTKEIEKAWDNYLWHLSKEKDPTKLKEGLTALEAKRLRKLKQLGVPSGKTKTKGVSKSDVEVYGEGISKL